MSSPERVIIFCVGNRLMMDDGVGPAIFDEIEASYALPPEVEMLDVGCMSLSMVERVDEADLIITVDAVDGTGEPAGTVFRFEPEDMARHAGSMASLHDLKLVDLFDAAHLLGYEASGACFGMQVANRSPESVTVGLTPDVYASIPDLVDAVIAELVLKGHEVRHKADGSLVSKGWHHEMSADTGDGLH